VVASDQRSIAQVQEGVVRFEGRELTTYAKPVAGDALQVGTTYFSLTYLDDEMLVPILEPLVFIGRNLREGDVSQVYFQDAESYRRGITFDPTDDEAEPITSSSAIPAGVERAVFYDAAQNDTTNIFEYEHALDELLKCSLRRRQ
jgi:hypothetical protein